jgi:hypothetical protein
MYIVPTTRAIRKMAPITIPTIAPTDSPFLGGALPDPTDGDEVDEGCCGDGMNDALACSSLLSFAGIRSAWGHFFCAHGLLAQQPRNGGMAYLHVYHIVAPRGSSQSSAGMSTYASAAKDAGLMFAVGHFPFPSAHGFVVQQPMNSVALPWQM